MFLTTQQTILLPQIIKVLAEPQPDCALRLRLGNLLTRLLHADQFVSYVWNPAGKRFVDRVAIDMSDANLRNYEAYFQYNDPITHRLRARSKPTLVTEIVPQAELVRTEFFNDFLARDFLYWGMNVHVPIDGESTGDIRIWRSQQKGNFDATDLALLAIIAPAFGAALRRCKDTPTGAPGDAQGADEALALGLTRKEHEISRMVAMGLTDKQIASRLDISFSTVRTHLKHVFYKLSVNNRAQLIRRLR
ncbi:helix-turn-helix transcriptional regulator [Caballeronia sp. dw_19]|uniref:helix-turn-helix domain-containing protein n=1 Tax=Caballeronia sp. dw_19 TaxID=2719791 RepID=UPI001BD06EDA|nr:helix-turn-helix transcriptional regulator [Caballeronia sp. dw_19]